MDVLATQSRVKNLTGDGFCVECQNEVSVLVNLRRPGKALVQGKAREPQEDTFYEEMGPCPYCELGFQLEFPGKGHGPWGSEGFWRGRPHVIKTAFPHKEKPLPPEENGLRARLLLLRFEAIKAGRESGLPNPEVGLYDNLTDAARLLVLKEELKRCRFHGKTAEAEQAQLPAEPYGRCDDCHEQTDRYRYGKFALCLACVASRQRVKAKVSA